MKIYKIAQDSYPQNNESWGAVQAVRGLAIEKGKLQKVLEGINSIIVVKGQLSLKELPDDDIQRLLNGLHRYRHFFGDTPVESIIKNIRDRIKYIEEQIQRIRVKFNFGPLKPLREYYENMENSKYT